MDRTPGRGRGLRGRTEVESTYEPATGTFRMPVPTTGEVRVLGTGPERDWTLRAISRAGYAPSEHANLTVTWTGSRSGTRWLLARDGSQQIAEADSLGAIVHILRSQVDRA